MPGTRDHARGVAESAPLRHTTHQQSTRRAHQSHNARARPRRHDLSQPAGTTRSTQHSGARGVADDSRADGREDTTASVTAYVSVDVDIKCTSASIEGTEIRPAVTDCNGTAAVTTRYTWWGQARRKFARCGGCVRLVCKVRGPVCHPFTWGSALRRQGGDGRGGDCEHVREGRGAAGVVRLW